MTVGQSVNHKDTDGIHVHIRTFSFFVLSVDIVARWDLGFRAGLYVDDVSLSKAYCKIDAAGPEGRRALAGVCDRSDRADAWCDR